MPGSLTLLGGDPGVGKSTLLLQTAGSAARLSDRTPTSPGIGMGPATVESEKPGKSKSEDESQQSEPRQKRRGLGPVLYVSGEESADQIAMRASRLGIDDPELLLWCETDADRIAATIADSVHAAASSFENGGPDPFQDANEAPLRPPSLVVVDSIQTMLCDSAGSSSAGGITQVRKCVGLFLRLAKSTGVPIVLVGHVTKSGDVAGPRTVEHMVDCVLYLEGSGATGEGGGGGGGGGTTSSTRILRAAKNRFGSSEEVGVYEMSRGGRLVPITDPSSYFLSTRRDAADSEGCAVSVVLEGVRSMTVEVQALVAWSAGTGGYSGRRIVDGVSSSRLLLILAVLQKRYGISFHRQDVYVNVVGGMRLGGGGSRSGSSGGSDLAVAVALVSSLVGIPVRSDTAFVGEVGLLGEVRPVHSLDRRVGEARRMGFSRVVTPPADRRAPRKGGGSGPRKVSKGGIKQLMCDDLLDAINCGLVDRLPTRQTRSGPKLVRQKKSGTRRRPRTDDENDEMMDVLIVDDEEDDGYYE